MQCTMRQLMERPGVYKDGNSFYVTLAPGVTRWCDSRYNDVCSCHVSDDDVRVFEDVTAKYTFRYEENRFIGITEKEPEWITGSEAIKTSGVYRHERGYYMVVPYVDPRHDCFVHVSPSGHVTAQPLGVSDYATGYFRRVRNARFEGKVVI